MKTSKIRIILALFLSTTVLAAGCATPYDTSFSADSGFDPENPHLSKRDQKEIEIGKDIHREILSSFSVYTEPQANEYVKEITAMLAKASHRPGLPYECTILYSDKIYAAAAPGGHVYITTGFINILDNEAELAGVLAHEVAEIQYQNPKYSQGKQALQAAETVVGIAGGFFGPYGMLAFVGIAALNYMTDEKGLDQRVIMADRKAMIYMARSGYDPQGLIDVLYKVIYTEPNMVAFLIDYYNSRPVNADRLKQANKVFRQLDLANKSFDTNRQKFLNGVAGIKELYMEAAR